MRMQGNQFAPPMKGDNLQAGRKTSQERMGMIGFVCPINLDLDVRPFLLSDVPLRHKRTIGEASGSSSRIGTTPHAAFCLSSSFSSLISGRSVRSGMG